MPPPKHAPPPPRLDIIGLTGLPEFQEGDDLAALVGEAWRRDVGPARDTDILVLAQKAVSKAEGCFVRLADIVPSTLARAWAAEHGKDAALIELVLQQSRRIVRMDNGIVIAETRHGLVCANAGVDTSNVPAGWALTLPKDPDASARRLRLGLRDYLETLVGVVISDTFGRPWREGLTNVAIGLDGVQAVDDHRGRVDGFGRRLQVSVIAMADEVASAAELIMGKTRHVPAVVVRGLDARADGGSATMLLREPRQDLFR